MSAELRPSRKAQYRDLFDRLLDPVFLIDGESFKIIDANPSAENVFALPLPELLKSGFSKWLGEKELAEFERALRMARRSYYPRRARLFWKLKTSESVCFEAVLCQLATGQDSGKTLQVILHDVTLETRARLELEALSNRDEMTGLANFRAFKFELEREHAQAAQDKEPYSIVFCDVDHFKSYNDRMGHPAGDALLRGLGAKIRSQCRQSDLPARYGGEEFAVLCRGTSKEGALQLAERLRNAVEKSEFKDADGKDLGKVTLSLGVASFPEHAKTANDVLEKADAALYESKRNGRNRVTLSS